MILQEVLEFSRWANARLDFECRPNHLVIRNGEIIDRPTSGATSERGEHPQFAIDDEYVVLSADYVTVLSGEYKSELPGAEFRELLPAALAGLRANEAERDWAVQLIDGPVFNILLHGEDCVTTPPTPVVQVRPGLFASYQVCQTHNLVLVGYR